MHQRSLRYSCSLRYPHSLQYLRSLRYLHHLQNLHSAVPALIAVPARFAVPALFAIPKLFEVTATEVAESIVNVGAVTAERGRLRFLGQTIQSYERIPVFIPYRMYTSVSDNKKNMAKLVYRLYTFFFF